MCTIHDKLYLLSNSETGETRIIIGSANLSYQAFTNSQQQYESVYIVDDDPGLWDEELDWYSKHLLPLTGPYFPTKLLETYRTRLADAGEPADFVLTPASLSHDDRTAIKTDSVTNLFVDESKMIDNGQLPSTVLKDQKNLIEQTAERDEEDKQEDIAYTIVRQAVSRAKDPKLVPVKKLRRTIEKQLVVTYEADAPKSDDDLPSPAIIISKPEERDASTGTTGLFTMEKTEDENSTTGEQSDAPTVAKKLGHLASTDQICAGLEYIHRLVESYEKYTEEANEPQKSANNYGKRVYEALLYVFMSPFLWEFRCSAAMNDSSDSIDVPNMLILGSAAHSGKTTLLNVMARMTALPDGRQSVIQCDNLYSNDHQQNAETIRLIRQWEDGHRNHDSSGPIFLDEMPPAFFAKEDARKLIIAPANMAAIDPQMLMAPVIGTTNSKDMSLPPEAARRCYYLTFNQPFDSSNTNGKKVKDALLRDATNPLWLDFIVRMSERIAKLENEMPEGTGLWRSLPQRTAKDANPNFPSVDFLAPAREIFHDYYRIAHMRVPSFFPDDLVDDFAEKGRTIWRGIFLNAQKENKIIRKHDHGRLVLDIPAAACVPDNVIGYAAEREINKDKDLLPAPLCVGGTNGKETQMIAVKEKEFLSWIGETRRARLRSMFR